MTLYRHTRWIVGLLAALTLCGLALFAPGRPAGATDETFFQSGAPCPVAHCDQQLDGNEGLSIPLSYTPTVTTIYTPTAHVAFNIALGCTAGYGASGGLPDMVACSSTLSDAGSATDPFLYSLTATTSGNPISSVALATNWVTHGYTGTQIYPCTGSQEFAVDQKVSAGAPLISDLGYVYVSDDHSIVKYNPTPDGSGDGTCAWGKQNPDQATLISWNGVRLPANGSGANPYPGAWYVAGQGDNGPVVLADMLTARPVVTLTLSGVVNGVSGQYVTYNTISAVETTTGVRLYDSTQFCAAGASCNGLEKLPGRLYALDVTSPITAGGTPTMAVAWSYDFEGPSGASPMVLPSANNIFFDGSGPSCGSSCSSQPLHPTLFGLHDRCSFGSTCSSDPTTPTVLLDQDFGTSPYPTEENGYCPNHNPSTDTYEGIQAAPALEVPEAGGTNHDYSVWAHVSCGPILYRFDAQTGASWSGNGASSIDMGSFTGLNGYVPDSTMQTMTDTTTSPNHVVAFLGANETPPSKVSYVTALDLETGNLLWKVEGPSTVHDATDTPFHGQFPIAETSCGSGCTGYVLIAATEGKVDGGNILGLVLRGP